MIFIENEIISYESLYFSVRNTDYPMHEDRRKYWFIEYINHDIINGS